MKKIIRSIVLLVFMVIGIIIYSFIAGKIDSEDSTFVINCFTYALICLLGFLFDTHSDPVVVNSHIKGFLYALKTLIKNLIFIVVVIFSMLLSLLIMIFYTDNLAYTDNIYLSNPLTYGFVLSPPTGILLSSIVYSILYEKTFDNDNPYLKNFYPFVPIVSYIICYIILSLICIPIVKIELVKNEFLYGFLWFLIAIIELIALFVYFKRFGLPFVNLVTSNTKKPVNSQQSRPTTNTSKNNFDYSSDTTDTITIKRKPNGVEKLERWCKDYIYENKTKFYHLDYPESLYFWCYTDMKIKCNDIRGEIKVYCVFTYTVQEPPRIEDESELYLLENYNSELESCLNFYSRYTIPERIEKIKGDIASEIEMLRKDYEGLDREWSINIECAPNIEERK